MNGTGLRALGRQMRVSALAVALLSLWVVVHIFAAMPQFHHAVHEDASSPEHHCLLADFSSASFEPTPLQPDSLSPALSLCGGVSDAVVALVSDTSFRLHAARPPPVTLQSFTQTGS